MSDSDNSSPASGGLTFRQLFVWIILGALAIVFGLSFGLPTDAITSGAKPIARVYGQSLHGEDFIYQRNSVASFVGMPADERYAELMGVKESLVDYLVERIVLVEFAHEIGLEAEQIDAEILTERGFSMVLGDAKDWTGGQPFNYEAFQKRLLPALQVAEPAYLEIQRQEILASAVRDLIIASTVVPEPELRRLYNDEASRVSLRYVRFPAAVFADLVDPTPVEVDAWLEGNKEALLTSYSTQTNRFTQLPAQARVSLIKLNKPSLPIAPSAEDTSEHQAALAKVKERAESTRQRIIGGAPFQTVAREASQDLLTARAGGDYGWTSLADGASGLEALVEVGARELAEGAEPVLVEAGDAWWIVRVEGRREGDVPEAAAMRELAIEAIKRERGRTLAKQAAAEAILAIQGGRSMAEAFPALESFLIDESADPARPATAIPLVGIRQTGAFARGALIPGLGLVPDLAEAAWTLPTDAAVIDDVFDIADGSVIAGIESRTEASEDDYLAKRAESYDDLRLSRGRRVLSSMALRRCLEAKGRSQIAPYMDRIAPLIRYDSDLAVEDDGTRNLRAYSMCDRVGSKGGFLSGPGIGLGGSTGGGG